MYRNAAQSYQDSGLTDAAIRREEPRIAATLTAMWTDGFTQVGDRVADQISRATRKSFKQMSVARRAALDLFIARYSGRKITQITTTTMFEINRLIERGIEDGLSVDEVAATILQTGQIYASYRGPLIARTEIHSAAQYGSLSAAQETGVVTLKEWIPVQDARTRDGDNTDFDHTNVESVPVNDPFIVSGEALMYPGDPAGSAGNIINCRCAMGYIVD